MLVIVVFPDTVLEYQLQMVKNILHVSTCIIIFQNTTYLSSHSMKNKILNIQVFNFQLFQHTVYSLCMMIFIVYGISLDQNIFFIPSV